MQDTLPEGSVRSKGPVLGAGPDAELSNIPGPPPQPSRKCRFYGTRQGCKAGAACPYFHDPDLASDGRSHQPRQQEKKQTEKPSATAPAKESTLQVSNLDNMTARHYNAPLPDATRLVQRPVPQSQVQDPKAFQLGQIRRRYRPTERETPDGISLTLKITPSDPDFPFDIAALACTLSVSNSYPSSPPTLRVTNKEMGRGFQINVEKGFNDIVQRLPNGTLLQYLNALDKELENFLAAPKAETVKLVGYVDKRHLQPQFSSMPGASESNKEKLQPAPVSKSAQPPKPYVAVRMQEQLAQAQRKREADVRQLEARLGRLPQYAKSNDGLAYTIPVEPRKRSSLPASLQAIKTLKLIVPQMYNLDPCRIQLQGVTGDDAVVLEDAFRLRAESNPNLFLVSHLNYLSQNMHTMATGAPRKPVEEKPADVIPLNTVEQSPITTKAVIHNQDDRGHIITIPRPPEWTTRMENDDSDSGDSDYYDLDDESDEEVDNEEGGEVINSPPSGPERGILLSLPFLELHGIELLELVSLSLTIKCDRCKTTMDVKNIMDRRQRDASGVHSESCRKCANSMDIGYREDLMHVNSVRAGYIDLDGCTVVDLLPSNFIPTCSECSTSYPAPGLVSVRGESSITVCRECHHHMSFRIPEVKFLQVSAAAARASRAPPRKKKEQLGVTAGQELPRCGRCSHYGKSYRWFRFSCCNKVFACDKCHDLESDHPNEHANRMLCGFCSREQNYRPEDCGICHSILIGKKGSGFWEGGKGTRDKSRMSRKDPRKYKRNPGSKFKPLDRSAKDGKKKIG